MVIPAPRWSAIGRAALSVLAAVTGGCGGDRLARKFQVPAEKQVALAAADLSGRTVHFPADAPFNITDKTSTQSPGMDGTANSAADAEPTGTAFCRLEAENGGSAHAEFHLGQCFNNASDRPQDALVTFLCEYTTQVELSEGAERDATTDYTLELYVSNPEGLVLKRLPVESTAIGHVPSTGSGRMVKEFLIHLEPRRAYNMVLAGMVRAETARDNGARMKIEVQRFELSVRTESAPD